MENYTLLLFITILLLSFAGLIMLLSLSNHNLKKHQAKTGLQLLLSLKTLFVLTQQHRGLSNGYLSGDEKLLLQIEKVQTEIRSVYHDLQHQLTWPEGSQQLSAINASWDRASTQFKQQSVASNFSNHCQLIATILDFIDDCAEYYALYELKDSNQNSIRYLWQELLTGIESIGQLRAIGTGVAASGECSSVDKIRLNYLQENIKQMRNASNPECAISRLIDTVHNKVAINQPMINAKEFFQEATMTLNANIDVFDREIGKLNNIT